MRSYIRFSIAVLYFLIAGLSADAKAQAIDHDDSRKVVMALLWTGDFDRLVDTAPPEYTVKAIRAFQRRQGFRQTGKLTPDQKRLLFAMAQQISDAVGAQRISDARAGLTLIVPRHYVTQEAPTRTGTLLTGTHLGPFALVTFALPGGDLEQVYQLLRTTVGGPDAKTRFEKLEQNRMILVRIHDPLRTYVLVARGPVGLKGFSMTWSLENTELLHRAVSVAANSLVLSVPHTPPAPRREPSGPKPLDAHDLSAALSGRSVIDVLTSHRIVGR